MVYVVVGAILGGVAFYLITRKTKSQNNESPALALDLLLSQLNSLQATVDRKLGEGERSLKESLQFQSRESNRVIQDITERLTRLDETSKQVVGFADQLRDLQDILKNPKQRGVLGEYYLETLLKNVLPPGSFQMQYPFKDGTIVDAVVFVKDKIIPIDSKFSLENYNRILETKDQSQREELERLFRNDLKTRIDETGKYVKPEEDTMDFAFMFIPHEAIYYDLLVAHVGAVKVATRDLVEYAFKERHVIIVSPTSFMAYLQTVLQGLRALQIETSAKEIRKRVEELGRHLKSYEDYHNRLGNSLRTVVNHYGASSRELKKVDKDVVRISGTSPGLSLESVSMESDPEESEHT